MLSGENVVFATCPNHHVQDVSEVSQAICDPIKFTHRMSKQEMIQTLNDLRTLNDFNLLYLPEFYCDSASLDWNSLHESRSLRETMTECQPSYRSASRLKSRPRIAVKRPNTNRDESR